MVEKKSMFRGVHVSESGKKFRAQIEIYGRLYRSDSFDDEISAAMLYDALCKVLRRDTRRNFPHIETHGPFTKTAKAIYRRAREENPGAVKKLRSEKSRDARLKSYERNKHDQAIIEAAGTAGMLHAASHPALPLVDPDLPASQLVFKLRVPNASAALRLAMLQFPWETTVAERQLYWRTFARGCKKIILNRQRRGVSPEEAAAIAASF